jgi:hypothetical protein
MKKAPILASLALATSTLMASAAKADTWYDLHQDVLDFKNAYVANIRRAAEDFKLSDKINIEPIIQSIEISCGPISKNFNSDFTYLNNCLVVIRDSKRELAFQNGYDETAHQILVDRLANLSTMNPSAKFSYEDAKQQIDLGCPGSFTDFQNLTSPDCVKAQIKVLKNVALEYKRERESQYALVFQHQVSDTFKKYCIDGLTTEVEPPYDNHGRWYNELYEVSSCLNVIPKQIEASQFDFSPELKKIYNLSARISDSYDNAYEKEYPQENWDLKRPKNAGANLNALFGRDPI